MIGTELKVFGESGRVGLDEPPLLGSHLCDQRFGFELRLALEKRGGWVGGGRMHREGGYHEPW